MTTAQIDQLKNQLRAFGLNPREWTLRPETRSQAILQNRRDRSFQLQGKVSSKAGSARWTTLSLISL